jgi:hypothetical protein
MVIVMHKMDIFEWPFNGIYRSFLKILFSNKFVASFLWTQPNRYSLHCIMGVKAISGNIRLMGV